MKQNLQSTLIRALAVLVIAGLAGTWAVGAVRDKQEVAKMTEKMKTVCVGRFLIDLPEEARVALSKQRIDGFDIETYEEPDAEFWARVSARETEIRAKPDRLGGNKNLESVKEVKTDSGLIGKIFVHGRTVTEGQSSDGFTVEHYRYEGITVEALVHARGVSIDLSAENRHPSLIEKLPRLVAQLVANPGNRIPTEPGYCIDLAYFSDPLTADQGEQIMMMANLPSHPDIELMLIMAAGTKPDKQGLLERSAETNAKLSLAEKMRISDLRAAPRTIAGLTGDELVERFVEENHSIGYTFWWEVNGTEDNVFIPHFSFTMDTGKGNHQPVPSSLSERAALGLWDKITSSIRFRPTQAPKTSAAEPPTPAIGTLASAGDTCPQSGWWLCGDGGNGISVLGGQRQYIRQGERMPQALLLLPQTLWQKWRGIQPSFEAKTPTPWRLVDKRNRERITPTVPLAQATVVAPAATSAAAGGAIEQQTSVGIHAATGIACPASGWWRCEDSHALDGTRWFTQGSLLPDVTFAMPAGVFSRVTGTSKTIQRPGTWMLVRLAQAPGLAGNAGETHNQNDQAGRGTTPGGSAT